MSRANRYAYLQIEGSFAPETVTETLNIIPTKTRSIGEVSRKAMKHSTAMWRIESDAPRTERLEIHISNLLAKVEGSSGALRDLSKKNEAWIQLVSLNSFGQENSSLSCSLISQVAGLGLGIDIELYPSNNEAE